MKFEKLYNSSNISFFYLNSILTISLVTFSIQGNTQTKKINKYNIPYKIYFENQRE